jgi:precorrin-6B C5,15-methyltransferase / cobalt-precorrin-6B C5,C15-methyltransferase
MRMSVSELPHRATNTTPQRWLSIVGIGEDGIEGLSSVARRLVMEAELVVGGERHLALAAPLLRGERLAWPRPIEAAFADIIAKQGRPVVVLASGDPFHFGIGKQLAELVSPEELVCLPHASAFALAAARMGWALQDVAMVSLHGRALAGIIRHLHPGARILALSWDGSTPAQLAKLLGERGLGASTLTVLERMGGPSERRRTATANRFDIDGIDSLNTIALEVVAGADARIAPLAPGLDDALFENDGQLTKREVRAVVLSSLAPRHGELLWDIGLGAGSIAIEWLLCHPSLRAIGIEERPERATRAARNAAALGATDLQIVTGRAPDALMGLPAPDATFIGGGLSDGVLESAWGALKPGGRLVANAVTIEGEQQLSAALLRFRGELVRIEIARAELVGALHGWRAAMPVTQLRIKKP